MTVQAAKRMWSRHTGKHSATDSLGGTAEVTENYQIISDADDTLPDIYDAPDLPRMDDGYPDYPGLYVKDMSVTQVSPIFWIMTVVYKGEYGEDARDNPLNAPPIRSWTNTTSNEATDEDVLGNPIVTVNGEPIDGVTIDISDLKLTVERNYSAFLPEAVHAYLHSTNSDTFFGFPPGTCRFTGFTAKEKFDERIGGYWAVVAHFEFRYPWRTTPDKAWFARVRHEGHYIKDGEGNIRRAGDDLTDNRVKMVLLNLDGTEQKDATAATWLEFQRYTPLPYSIL